MTVRTYTDDRRLYYSWLGGGTTPYGYYYYRSQNGANSPEYPSVLRDNAYDLYLRFYDSTPFDITFSGRPGYPDRVEHWYRTRYAVPDPILNWTSNDTIILTNKLASKVRDHNMNVGNFLIESDQTVRMFGNTVYRIASAIHYVRHGQIGRAATILTTGRDLKFDKNRSAEWYKKVLSIEKDEAEKRRRKNALRKGKVVLRTPANLWLELTYGWEPLVSDLVESAKAYEAIVTRPFVQTFRVARKIQASTIHTGTTARPIVGTSRKTIRKGYIARCSERESVASSLQLDNPLGALWEWTKFSFIVDWVIPVGQFIEASHAAKSLKIDKCVVSTKTTVTGGISGLWSGYQPNYPVRKGFCETDTDKLITFKREILTTLPRIPPPKAKAFADVATVKHTQNAIALLTQVVTSSRPHTNDLSVGRVVRYNKWDI